VKVTIEIHPDQLSIINEDCGFSHPKDVEIFVQNFWDNWFSIERIDLDDFADYREMKNDDAVN